MSLYLTFGHAHDYFPRLNFKQNVYWVSGHACFPPILVHATQLQFVSAPCGAESTVQVLTVAVLDLTSFQGFPPSLH